jgi:hypothetical protein
MEAHLKQFCMLFRLMFEPFGSYANTLDKDMAQVWLSIPQRSRLHLFTVRQSLLVI